MLLLFQATATQLADSTQIAADKLMEEAIANADGLDKLSLITQQLVDFGIRAGERILIATLVFIVGRFLISMLNRFVGRLMDRRKVDISIKTFVKSLVNILLTILLIISVVGALGVETTSFAALLASAGVAVGMALSVRNPPFQQISACHTADSPLFGCVHRLHAVSHLFVCTEFYFYKDQIAAFFRDQIDLTRPAPVISLQDGVAPALQISDCLLLVSLSCFSFVQSSIPLSPS